MDTTRERQYRAIEMAFPDGRYERHNDVVVWSVLDGRLWLWPDGLRFGCTARLDLITEDGAPYEGIFGTGERYTDRGRPDGTPWHKHLSFSTSSLEALIHLGWVFEQTNWKHVVGRVPAV